MSPLHSRSAYVPRGIMPHLRLLGPTELETGAGRSIDRLLAQPKSVALVAFLAAAGSGFHRRDRLVGLFWPEMDDRSARRNLRGRIHLLRKFLGDDVVVSRGDDEVGLDPDRLRCDVWEFEEAVAAEEWDRTLELYRGDLLEGFHLNGDGAFLHWLDGRRAELRTMAAEAARSRSGEAERARDLRAAVDAARRLVGLAPTDEVAVRRLLILLDAAGDRAGMAAAYEAFETRLEDEYALEPAPETKRLVEELLSRSEPNGPVPSGTGKGIEVPSVMPSDPIPDIPRQADRPPFSAARRRRPPRFALAVGVVVLGVLAVFGLSWGSRFSGSSGGASAHVPARDLADLSGPSFQDRRVVVAPFENRTGDPSLDVIGRAAADWTAQGLMETGMVEVVSPGEVLRNALAFQRETGAGPGAEMAMELAEGSRARILVSGSYLLEGDTLVFQARISDAKDGMMLRAVPRVAGPRDAPEGLLEPLRRRVLGSLATVLDPRLESWSAAASQPPSFEAYRLYAEGLDLFFHGDPAEAALRLREAWSVDTTFTAPLVWAVFAYGNALPAERDTVLAYLTARRDRMAPWDRAMTDFVEARFDGDFDAAVEAAHRAVSYAPDSEWIYKIAWAAVLGNRYREALDALARIDPDRGWMREFPGYWLMLISTSHDIGDHEEALRAIRVLRERFDPDARKKGEILSLIGLGRLDEAWDMATRDVLEVPELENPPAYVDVFDDLAVALRARGRHQAADSLARRALGWYEALPESTTSGLLGRYGHAKLLAQTGDLERAALMFDAVAEEFGPERMGTMSVGRRGVVAARQGDTVRAAAILESLTTDPMPPEIRESRRHVMAAQRARWAARIATELGRPEQAIRLWRRAWENRLSAYRVRLESHRLHDQAEMQALLRDLDRVRATSPFARR